jgi:hypothetical protein
MLQMCSYKAEIRVFNKTNRKMYLFVSLYFMLFHCKQIPCSEIRLLVQSLSRKQLNEI